MKTVTKWIAEYEWGSANMLAVTVQLHPCPTLGRVENAKYILSPHTPVAVEAVLGYQKEFALKSIRLSETRKEAIDRLEERMLEKRRKLQTATSLCNLRIEAMRKSK